MIRLVVFVLLVGLLVIAIRRRDSARMARQLPSHSLRGGRPYGAPL